MTHKRVIDWFVKGGCARRARERSVPMTPTVRDALRGATEAAVRPARGWVFPHLFRHAWARRLAMAGVDRKSLQEPGGWSDGRMLDEVYAHVTPDHLGAIMARSGIGGG